MKTIFTLTFFLLLMTGCKKNATPEPSYPVEIGEAMIADIPHFIKGVGRLSASLLAELQAQVNGTLTNVLFTGGQMVEEGDLLMTIDPRVYEAQVQEAKSQLAEDQAKLKYAKEYAEAYGKLVGRDYVSKLSYEEALQNVATYQAAVELDIATIRRLQVALGHTSIRAPFKGYTGLRRFDPGNYANAASGEVLVTVRMISPLIVRFFIPSEFVREIRTEQEKTPLFLQAELPNDPSHPLEGTLAFIDNNVDSQTGMILLEGNIPNLDERGWPGQFARVHLRLRTLKDAVIVPKQAIVLGQSGHFVYVLDESTMTVSMVTVVKGLTYKDHTVVLKGLEGGEKIITDGQLNLFNQAKVYIPKDKGVQ